MRFFAAAFALARASAARRVAGTRSDGRAAAVYRYADIADLAIARADGDRRNRPRRGKIKGPDAADVAPGYVRLYVTVDVIALIRGARRGAAAHRLSLRCQAGFARQPAQAEEAARAAVRAARSPTAADQVQLISQRRATDLEPRDRSDDAPNREPTIVAADLPPAITGIANAFHAAGTLPGEGETQIFLKTSGHPISLSIIRKQDQPPVWTVSLSEVVEDALPPPQRDTFLWYRLACGLPADLPRTCSPGSIRPTRPRFATIMRWCRTGLGACRG